MLSSVPYAVPLVFFCERLVTENTCCLSQDGGEDIRRVRQAIGEPLLPLLTFDNPETVKTTYEVWQMQRHKEQLQQAFLAQWLSTASVTSTGRPIDALLCPVSCTPAYVPGTVFWAGYTGMFNLLDLPASAVPVTLVDPNIDRPDPAFKPLTAKDAEVHETCALTGGLLDLTCTR